MSDLLEDADLKDIHVMQSYIKVKSKAIIDSIEEATGESFRYSFATVCSYNTGEARIDSDLDIQYIIQDDIYANDKAKEILKKGAQEIRTDSKQKMVPWFDPVCRFNSSDEFISGTPDDLLDKEMDGCRGTGNSALIYYLAHSGKTLGGEKILESLAQSMSNPDDINPKDGYEIYIKSTRELAKFNITKAMHTATWGLMVLDGRGSKKCGRDVMKEAEWLFLRPHENFYYLLDAAYKIRTSKEQDINIIRQQEEAFSATNEKFNEIMDFFSFIQLKSKIGAQELNYAADTKRMALLDKYFCDTAVGIVENLSMIKEKRKGARLQEFYTEELLSVINRGVKID